MTQAFCIPITDPTMQTLLATFTGALLVAVSAIVMLRAGCYGGAASVVVLALTVFAIAWIILAILRWIDCLRRQCPPHHTRGRPRQPLARTTWISCITSDMSGPLA